MCVHRTMALSLLLFILLWNTTVASTVSSLIQCAQATSTLPAANYKMAVGSNNGNLFLIGGTYLGTTSVVFKSKQDINNKSWSSSTHNNTAIVGESQFWTQHQSTVYMASEPYQTNLNTISAPHISTYDMANDVLTPKWMDITLPEQMRGCVTSSSDYLYFVGGYDPTKQDYLTETAYFNNVLMFHLISYAWTTAPSMHQRRRGHSCIVHNNKLWAIGGKNASSTFHISNAYHKSIERISVDNIQDNAWSPMSSALNSLTVGASGLRAVGYNEYIFVIGGYYDYQMGTKYQALDTIHIIDTTLDFVRLSLNRLPYTVSAAATIMVSDTIFVFGGAIQEATTVTDKWMYCKVTGSVSSTTPGPQYPPSETPTPQPQSVSSGVPTTMPSNTSVTTAETLVPSKVPTYNGDFNVTAGTHKKHDGGGVSFGVVLVIVLVLVAVVLAFVCFKRINLILNIQREGGEEDYVELSHVEGRPANIGNEYVHDDNIVRTDYIAS
eukprot:231126_1